MILSPYAVENFPATGGTANLTVTSSANWNNVGVSDGVLSLTPPTGGTGTTNVIIEVEANTGNSRTPTVEFYMPTNPDLTVHWNFNIYQNSGNTQADPTPLTFDILTGGTLVFDPGTATYANGMSMAYRVNNNPWTASTPGSVISLNVQEGDKVEFSGATDFSSYTPFSYNGSYFSGTSYFNLSGRLTSLVENVELATSTFAALFRYTNVVNASRLTLYEGETTTRMYEQMFHYCTSLLTAPPINYSYVAQRACQDMFSGCVNLKQIKCLVKSCGSNAFLSWTSSITNEDGTFIRNAGTSWPIGNGYIPDNWTVINMYDNW